MGGTLITKYGRATLNKEYYQITSNREGNNGKLLHRLIARSYFDDWIDDPNEPFDIHHIDGNKTNNCVLNLEPLPRADHMLLHLKGKSRSMKTKKKISVNLSKSKNITGYYRVSKYNSKSHIQGFYYVYRYIDDNGKRKGICSTNLEKLEEKVKSKGLTWKKIRNGVE